MTIVDSDITYLQDRLDFEEVLEGLGMEVSHWLGSWIMCHCPNTVNHANGDQSPSFGFNTDTMGWNCFVCGGGGLLSLVQEQLNCNQSAAIEWLTQMSSFEPSENLVDKVKKIMHPVKDESVMPVFPDEVYKFDEDTRYELFMTNRNISLEIAREAKIGFDEAHYGVTIPHWFDGKLRGWQTRHVLTENGKFYCNKCGGIGGFGPKYTNTKGFPKKNTLYLYDHAKGGTAVVVESPLSALYLWSMGISNTVATFGSFSDAQAELLKKFPKVVFWPDNDPAGVTNLIKAIANLAESVEVRIVPVVDKPHGDPGDLPSEQIYEYLFNAYPVSLFPIFMGDLPTLEQVQTYT